jgi:hypothetical protein
MCRCDGVLEEEQEAEYAGGEGLVGCCVVVRAEGRSLYIQSMAKRTVGQCLGEWR